MKKLFIMVVMVMSTMAIFCGCEGKKEKADYISITAQEAKALMDSESSCIILDVRTKEEYEEGHIPGAILLPLSDVQAQVEKQLKDKNQLILVYCRSGNRSKQASRILTDLGYTKIQEFGGIIDWPYETEQ